ncbi:MAG: hypothetical protein R2771_13895 [Saprospiraceae bacterium]
MENFYTDTKQLKFQLENPLMKKIVELKENFYSESEKYDFAPSNYEDAVDSYDQVLEIIGEICGTVIAANAEEVDNEGAHLEDGRSKSMLLDL